MSPNDELVVLVNVPYQALQGSVPAGLLGGFYEVLDVPARVPLRPLVEFLRPPLGLFAGFETSNFLLPEEHYRNYLVTRFFHRVLTLPLAYAIYQY